MKFKVLALAAAASLLASAAFAGPVAYVNSPFSTPQELANAVISNINAGQTGAASLVTASGTTTATASSLRAQISITGLVTAASTLSATMTVTNTLVAASSLVICQVNGYAGTGVPIAVNVVPAAGSFTMAIQNVATAAALNATVPVSCLVFS